MLKDSNSTHRGKVGTENNSRVKPDICKGASGSGSPPGLRRSTRETTSRKESTPSSSTTTPSDLCLSPSTMRKSERLEKKNTTPPAKRKLEKIEKEITFSTLRRSDRGKNHLSQRSADTKNNSDVIVSSDIKRKKLKREESQRQKVVETKVISERAPGCTKSNGLGHKVSKALYKKPLYSVQRRRAILPDSNTELEGPEIFCEDARNCYRGSEFNPVEDVKNGVEDRTKNIEEECVERNRRGLELPEADQSRVDVLPTPEVERLSGMDVEKEVDVAPPSSLECEKDKFLGTCPTCFKRRRLDYNSPVQQLCFCSISLNKDLHCTSTFEDSMELSQCNDSLLDAPKDGNMSTCAICNLDGELLRRCSGKSCKKSYHLSCLDLPHDDCPFRFWYCLSCLKKKIKCGVHSVSAGVEAIWDAREIEVQNDEEMQKQRQFFVKYKGLAHIHNHWIPENQLLLEAPMLISKFDQQGQELKWKEEWTTPHRLLKKRLLCSAKQQDDCQSDTLNCQCEWLVKWCGLDYEHATWELETAPFLHSPQAQILLREFENRHQRAKEAASPSSAEKSKKESVNLPKVLAPSELAAIPRGEDHDQVISSTKLLEFRHKGQNALVINDQDRIPIVIFFLLSLVSDGSQPFLIISTSSALSVWEAEFSRLAPSINVIVYSGSQDSRKIIRTSEFYEDEGRIMLQVLLSSVEAVVEDAEDICPWWEAIIIDEYQNNDISKYTEQVKMLKTSAKLLFFNDELKDNIPDYLNLLSLLESPENFIPVSCLKGCDLREKLSSFIAYGCKPESFRYLEYWVPTLMSNVQLEQYCFTLLSNATALRSSSKDIVGVLRDTLMSTRKCCDHPYMADCELQGLLTKGHSFDEILDVGVKASGKLQLLDMVLPEIKNRGLRVVILFQSICYAGSRIGDILDDYVRQRFGPDSYERIDGGVIASKKQAALKKFNDKSSGRFIFLLEKRACSATIKLSSLDAVVIFDSNWNPMTDLRALRKVCIHMSPEPIKIFRLYTSCAVEEKFLDLATNNVTLDNNFQNISRSTSHLLLMWGASYLFRKLDEYHGCNPSSIVEILPSDIPMLKDVAGEFLDLFIQDAESSIKKSFITEVRRTGGSYSKNAPLFGQRDLQTADEKKFHMFWSDLLERKNPQWRFLSVNSQRNRKRVQHGELLEKPAGEPDDVLKKQKKVVSGSADAPSSRTSYSEGGSGVGSLKSTSCATNMACEDHVLKEPFSSNSVCSASEIPISDSVEGIKLRDEQKNLHVLLKPAFLKLNEVLQLPEVVKNMGGRFLDYILDNHQVTSKPETILQAFQLCVVWVAASLVKFKVEKNQCLDLAKQHLNFSCTWEELTNVYIRLWDLKKMFKERSQKFEELDPAKAFSVDGVEQIHGKCEKWKEELLRKQEEEMQEFHRNYEVERARIEEDHRIESTVVRAIHTNVSVRLAKLQRIDAVFYKKMEEHKHRKDRDLQRILTKQMAERTEENLKAGSLLEETTSSTGKDLVTEQAHTISEIGVPDNNIHLGQENVGLLSGALSLDRTERTEVALPTVPTVASSEHVDLGVTAEIPTLPLQSLRETDISEIGVPNEIDLYHGQESADLVSGGKQSLDRTGTTEVASPTIGAVAASENVGRGFTSEILTVTFQTLCETDISEIGVPNDNNCRHGEGNVGHVSGERQSLDRPETTEVASPSGAEEQLDNFCCSDDASENSGVRNLPSTVQESSDGAAPSGARITNESAADKFVVGAIESSDPEGELNKVNNQTDCRNIHDSDAGDKWNDADGMPPVVTFPEVPVQAIVSPQILGPLDECPQPSTSTGIPDDDAPGCDINAMEDAEAKEQREPEQSQISEGQSQLDSRAASAEMNDGDARDNGSFNVTEQIEGRTLLPPPTGPVLTEHVPPVEHPPSQNGEQSVTQFVANLLPTLPVNQIGSCPPNDIPVVENETHLISRNAHQTDLQTQPQQSYPDPLQIELERLRKETEEANKLHEDTKLQLESECEKEIEEVVAEIRKKYETKRKGAEATYSSKKKELDANHNKVFMNRILAEAFRTKCLEFRPPVSSGTNQVPSANFLQQLLLLSSQPPRTPPVSSLPSVAFPAINQQTAAPTMPVHQRASPNIASTVMRPPRILPITRPSGNFPLAGEMRAPAPHLQPFRPSLSSSSPITIPPLPRGFSVHESQRHTHHLSTMVQAPIRLPPPHSQQLNLSSHLDNRIPQPESMRGLPSFQNPSVPGRMENLTGTRPPPNILHHVVDSSPNFVSQGEVQGGERGNGGVNNNLVRSSTAGSDVVCLSDDE